LFAIAGGHHLDIAVLAVAHPPGDANLRSFALDKPPEPDTLNSTGYHVTTCLKIRHGTYRVALTQCARVFGTSISFIATLDREERERVNRAADG
jgi:hypothetical protein